MPTRDELPAPVHLDQLRADVEQAGTLADESRFAALNDTLTDLLPRPGRA